jgi:3',5'-cyclic-AMP phosphodiesterase
MRIAHISDIHARYTSSFQSRFRYLLESIRDHNIEHLIITGDLTDKARSEEYNIVIDILNEHGFTSGNELTVIPGNHDVFPSVFQSFTFRLSTLREEFRREPLRVSKELYRVMRAYRKFRPEHYYHALRYFNARFHHTFDSAISIGSGETMGFPYIKHLNERYAAVCIESNYVSPQIKKFLPYALLKYLITKDIFVETDNPICSNGWVDTDLLRKALIHPEVRNKKIILLLHHFLYTEKQVTRYMSPLFANTMSLVNREAVVEELNRSTVELILHGHWHVTESYTVADGMLHAINGAGVFRQGDNRWSVVTLAETGIQYESVQY